MGLAHSSENLQNATMEQLNQMVVWLMLRAINVVITAQDEDFAEAVAWLKSWTDFEALLILQKELSGYFTPRTLATFFFQTKPEKLTTLVDLFQKHDPEGKLNEGPFAATDLQAFFQDATENDNYRQEWLLEKNVAELYRLCYLLDWLISRTQQTVQDKTEFTPYDELVLEQTQDDELALSEFANCLDEVVARAAPHTSPLILKELMLKNNLATAEREVLNLLPELLRILSRYNPITELGLEALIEATPQDKKWYTDDDDVLTGYY